MQRRSERGEGRLSTFIWLLIFAGVVYAGWHIAPVYIDHYSLKDKVVELCRLPKALNNDEKLMDLLMKEVRERDMTGFIGRQNFRIQTGDSSRKIFLGYERECEVLPGWKRVFHFSEDVTQPILY